MKIKQIFRRKVSAADCIRSLRKKGGGAGNSSRTVVKPGYMEKDLGGGVIVKSRTYIKSFNPDKQYTDTVVLNTDKNPIKGSTIQVKHECMNGEWSKTSIDRDSQKAKTRKYRFSLESGIKERFRGTKSTRKLNTMTTILKLLSMAGN